MINSYTQPVKRKSSINPHHCLYKGHKLAPITYVCLQTKCSYSRICCSYCLIDYHNGHDVLKAKQLQEQLNVQKTILTDLICQSLNSLQTNDQEMLRMVQSIIEPVRNQFARNLIDLQNNIINQISHSKVKLIRIDKNFTLHYEDFSKKIVGKGNELSLQQKARLFVQLKEQRYGFPRKNNQIEYKIRNHVNELIRYYHNELKDLKKDLRKRLNQIQKINILDKILISKGIFQSQYQLTTPIKNKNDLITTFSDHVSNQQLIQSSLKKKSKLISQYKNT